MAGTENKAADKPVIIRYTADTQIHNGTVYVAGAEYEVESAAAAKELHPEAKIVRYADNSKYTGKGAISTDDMTAEEKAAADAEANPVDDSTGTDAATQAAVDAQAKAEKDK